MAPQLLGYYWVSSWHRLPQGAPPCPCASRAQRRMVLRLAPPRRRAGAVRVVADASPALALDRRAEAVEIQFTDDEEGVVERDEERDAVHERERLRRLRISQANKGNTPWNKGRKHSPETLQRIRERTRIAMQDPKVKKKLMNLGHAQRSDAADPGQDFDDQQFDNEGSDAADPGQDYDDQQFDNEDAYEDGVEDYGDYYYDDAEE